MGWWSEVAAERVRAAHPAAIDEDDVVAVSQRGKLLREHAVGDHRREGDRALAGSACEQRDRAMRGALRFQHDKVQRYDTAGACRAIFVDAERPALGGRFRTSLRTRHRPQPETGQLRARRLGPSERRTHSAAIMQRRMLGA